MAYIDSGDETLVRKVIYRPCEIRIVTPYESPYENFQIVLYIEKIYLDPNTNAYLGKESAGSFSKLLSQIEVETVQAVEYSIGVMMIEKYGGAAQYGPMPSQPQ